MCKDDDEPPTKRVKLQQGAGDDDIKSVPPTEATGGGLVVSGLAVALCCHHRCDWRHYVGKEFFSQRGLGPEDFAAFQRMSSWATCGMRKFGSKTSEQPSDRNTEDEHEKNEEAIPDILNGVMSVEDREQIGRLCKLLIDEGRVYYLKQRGFESSLKYYTSRDVSLENVLLTAVPSSNQNTEST